MRADSLLPPQQLEAIVTALYADAETRGWATLPPQERSRRYAAWVEDPRVGGVLTRFMSPESARSWIKDGPMKEYANAQRGTGRYARFGRQGGTGPSDIAVAALGPGAAVTEGSEGVKPPHCLATTAAGQSAYLAWGPSQNFRNLVWAALRAAVADGLDAHVVVLETTGLPTTTADSAFQRAVASRCGLRLHYLPERLGSARPNSEATHHGP